MKDQLKSTRFAVLVWAPTVFTAFIYLSATALTIDPTEDFLTLSFFFVGMVIWQMRKIILTLSQRIEDLEAHRQ